MMPESSLSRAFESLKRSMFENIDGCLVERTATGYNWGGQEFKTVDELREYWKTLIQIPKNKACYH